MLKEKTPDLTDTDRREISKKLKAHAERLKADMEFRKNPPLVRIGQGTSQVDIY